MNAARRPPPERRVRDARCSEPRAVVEGAARALQQHAAPPADSFAAGVEAYRAFRRMCPGTDGGCDLAPCRPAEETPEAAALGGLPRMIRFPPFWHAWFSGQTEPRLATIDELVDERIARRVLRGFFRRLGHALMVAFIASAAAAHWFSDQVAWLVQRMPALKAFWALVSGAR